MRTGNSVTVASPYRAQCTPEKCNLPKSRLGVLIIGLDDDQHVYNISVEDSHFNNVAKGGNDIKGAHDVTLKNLYINGELVK